MICGSYGSFILGQRNCNYKLSGLRFHQRQMSHQDFTNRLKIGKISRVCENQENY